jgi:hydroxymethylglutaryl-CoA synthase
VSPPPRPAGQVAPVGVVAVGAAAPSLRMACSAPGAAWGAGGAKGTVAVCDADEDTLTLAWAAARGAMEAAGVEPEAVSGLWWGTTRPPFAEGPSHAFLAAALGLAPEAGGVLCAGSSHAGMEALLGAWDAVAAGQGGPVLVVASDALVPGVGTAGEASTGAGAVCLVLEAEPSGARDGSGPPALLTGRASRSMPVVDRYRGHDEAATADVYDGRLFREQVFLPLVAGAGGALGHLGRWSVSDPDGTLAPAAATRLGGVLVSSGVRGQIGDAGAAGALLGAAGALGEAGPLGAVGYGGGRASAVAIEVRSPVPGAGAVAGALGEAVAVDYVGALRARGQLRPRSDPIPMGVPPGGAAFVRGNLEMLSLEGARCSACGTVSTPPSVHPRCIGCGGGELEVVHLARRGRVHTFVVNQTMPPPFTAPLPLVVLDLDDGARLMVQGVGADAGHLAVGDEMVLVLRRYALERAIPVYGYKARRVEPAPAGPHRDRVIRGAAGAAAPTATAREVAS